MNSFESYIEVIGPDAKAQANAIAEYYGAECKESEDDSTVWIVECNASLEADLCYNDEQFNNALESIEAKTGVHIEADALII